MREMIILGREAPVAFSLPKRLEVLQGFVINDLW